MASQLPAEFIVNIDNDRCRRCKRCTVSCGFGALEFRNKVTPIHKKCVACQRCVTFCPEDAITITENQMA